MAGVVHHNTGKTILGMCSVHSHAIQKEKTKYYRAIVMCPDHLIDKWVREIQETIPDVDVMTFENWKSCIGLLDRGRSFKKTIPAEPAVARKQQDVNVLADYTYDEVEYRTEPSKDRAGERTLEQERKTWLRNERPLWVVLGRNQSKFNPNWEPIGEREQVSRMVERNIVVGKSPKLDHEGKVVKDKDGYTKYKCEVKKFACCPKCGNPIIGKDKMPLALSEVQSKQTNCKHLYLQQISEESSLWTGGNKKEKWTTQGLDKITDRRVLLGMLEDAKPGRIIKAGGRRYVVRACDEPLWQWTRQPYRWPPSKLIHKKLKGFFDYVLIDEIHEEKSAESAQSMAAGKLIASCRKMLALTGTLIGGYANHLFPLLIRMCPKGLVINEGMTWGESLKFSQKYGRVDTIITTKTEGGGERTVRRGQTGMGKKLASESSSKRNAVRPGIMPSLFGNHLMGNAIFLGLEEMDASLPRLINYPIDDESDPEFPGAGPIACEMDRELALEYKRIEETLDRANSELLKTGSMKLLGATLHTLLDYPDRPYDWPPKYPADAEHDKPSMAVGYHIMPNLPKTRNNWANVVQPADLDKTDLRSKEAELIKICMREKKKRRQVWVYCQMTGKRDIQPRLKKLLEERGLKVEILRSNTATLKNREKWIKENAKGIDVMISHPALVSTGLDLFDKGGGHNFSTIVFYETGYNLFTMRQAERRAWRIGQKNDCLVYYLFYAGTMQERAMALMAKKMHAAQSIDGKFTTEGLLSMAGDDNAQLALARSLSEKIEDQRRQWIRFGEAEKRAVIKAFKQMEPVIENREEVDTILGEGAVAHAFTELCTEILRDDKPEIKIAEIDETDTKFGEGIDLGEFEALANYLADSDLDLSSIFI